MDAVRVRNHVHGLAPFPGAYSEIDCGGRMERVKILRAAVVDGSGAPGAILDSNMTVACGDRAIRVLRSPARRQNSRCRGAELMRGGKIVPGARFSLLSQLPDER